MVEKEISRPGTAVQGVVPAERRGSARLPDGRRLAWSEWGPEDALPVLFCTGAGMSGSLGFGADSLQALGLRLMAFDRPGLGRSGAHEGKSLASWAADVGAALRLAEPAVAVGFSQGAPFALALAGAGLVRAVALVSPQDQIAHPSVRGRLAPEVAAMVEAAEADPAGFERWAADAASAEWMLEIIRATAGEADREVYAAEPFASMLRAAVEEAFAEGPAGYARDLRIALGPWPWAPEQIEVPVDVWFGELDTSPVHSPDLGEALARRLPRGWRRVVPGEGGAVLWTRPGEILKRLRAHV